MIDAYFVLGSMIVDHEIILVPVIHHVVHEFMGRRQPTTTNGPITVDQRHPMTGIDYRRGVCVVVTKIPCEYEQTELLAHFDEIGDGILLAQPRELAYPLP